MMDANTAIEALTVLYEASSSAEQRCAANEWLQVFRKHPDSWGVCATMLNQEQLSPPLKLFAAQVILYKSRKAAQPASLEDINGLFQLSAKYIVGGMRPIAIQLGLSACVSLARNMSCQLDSIINGIHQICTGLAEEGSMSLEAAEGAFCLFLALLPEEGAGFKGHPQRQLQVKCTLKEKFAAEVLPYLNEKVIFWVQQGSINLLTQAFECLVSWQAIEGCIVWENLECYPAIFDAAFTALLLQSSSCGQEQRNHYSSLANSSCEFLCMGISVCPPALPGVTASARALLPAATTGQLGAALAGARESGSEEVALRICMVVTKAGSSYLGAFEDTELAVHWQLLLDHILRMTESPFFAVVCQALEFWNSLFETQYANEMFQEILTKAFISLVARTSFTLEFEHSDLDFRDEFTELRRQIRDVLRAASNRRPLFVEWYAGHALQYFKEHASSISKWAETESHLHALSAVSKDLCGLPDFIQAYLHILHVLPDHPAVLRSAGHLLQGVTPALLPPPRPPPPPGSNRPAIEGGGGGGAGWEGAQVAGRGRYPGLAAAAGFALRTLAHGDGEDAGAYPMVSQEDHVCPACLYKLFRQYPAEILDADGVLFKTVASYQEIWRLAYVKRENGKNGLPISTASATFMASAIALLSTNNEGAVPECIAECLECICSVVAKIGNMQMSNSLLGCALECTGILLGAAGSPGIQKVRAYKDVIFHALGHTASLGGGSYICSKFFLAASKNSCLILEDYSFFGLFIVEGLGAHPNAVDLLRSLQPLSKEAQYISVFWPYCAQAIEIAINSLATASSQASCAGITHELFLLLTFQVQHIPAHIAQVLAQTLECACSCLKGDSKDANKAVLGYLKACSNAESNDVLGQRYAEVVIGGRLAVRMVSDLLLAVFCNMPSAMLEHVVDTFQAVLTRCSRAMSPSWVTDCIWTALGNNSISVLKKCSDVRKKEFITRVEEALQSKDWRKLKISIKSFCGGKKKQPRKAPVV